MERGCNLWHPTFGGLSEATLPRPLAALARRRGSPTGSGTAVEFGKSIDDETRKWNAMVRGAGLKGE